MTNGFTCSKCNEHTMMGIYVHPNVVCEKCYVPVCGDCLVPINECHHK